jgi:hypothetical protein
MGAIRVVVAVFATLSLLGCDQTTEAPVDQPIEVPADQSSPTSDSLPAEATVSVSDPVESSPSSGERQRYSSLISLDRANWQQYGEGEYPLSIVNVYLSCRQRGPSAPREVWIRTAIGNYGLNQDAREAGWQPLNPSLRLMRDGQAVSLAPMINLGLGLCQTG